MNLWDDSGHPDTTKARVLGREIAELRADLASIRSVYDFAALEAKIAKLQVALKPFAVEAESMIKNEEGWPEDKPLYSDGKVTIADYRRAAQALEQKEDGK